MTTPQGRPELPKTYDPTTVEGPTYRRWLDMGAFRADPASGRPRFSMALPPPNVTGSLHIGHALDHTYQDYLARLHRMRGDEVLWLPGMDHAGIATQNVVERELAKEGKTRFDLGREAFVERVWAWKAESGGRILGQMQRLGDSVDWSRERFTMDEGLSRAVREVFVSLYEQGLLYRGRRIINWCPRCLTALSDIEVEHEEVPGELAHLRYPLADGSGWIGVATSRAETMLGDTAVAVHPDDPRYRDLVGTTVRLPLVDRLIPVVADAAVDREFGTGAVKVTPAHDPNDHEIAERHGLPAVDIFTEEAIVNAEGGRFEGLDRYAARREVKAALAELGLLERVEEAPHSVGHCYRCRTEVEPRLSLQWFVATGPLAEEAMEAVRSGKTRFEPARYEKTFFGWMEQIRDWCVSRQLWWGHRIPAWYCPDGHVTVARQDPAACATCGAGELAQDEDVLDTWFSSGLWPFSTLGWPEETEDLAAFYPTSVLVTGYDIIFFWVARMLMFGCHFQPPTPFEVVAIHGMVRDAQGKKMSKSFGNVIDPIELMDRYGTDALRFALIRGANPGTDVPLAEEWVEGARNFANKLWNLGRFVMGSIGGADKRPEPPNRARPSGGPVAPLPAGAHAGGGDRGLRRIRPGGGGAAAARVRLERAGRLGGRAGQATPGRRGRGRPAGRGHPGLRPRGHPDAAAPGDAVRHRGAEPGPDRGRDPHPRSLAGRASRRPRPGGRGRHGRPPGGDRGPAPVPGRAPGPDREPAAAAGGARRRGPGRPVPGRGRQRPPPGPPGGGGGRVGASGHPLAKLLAGRAELYLPLEGLLDLEEERARLDRELATLGAERARAEAKLANPAFLEKAPAPVVAKARERLAEVDEALAKVRAQQTELAGTR